MTTDMIREMIKELNGRIFHVNFIKKDGSERKMLCRTGVTKHLKGGELSYDPIEKGLLSVFDMEKGEYRMVNLNTIITIKADGKIWDFKGSN